MAIGYWVWTRMDVPSSGCSSWLLGQSQNLNEILLTSLWKVENKALQTLSGSRNCHYQCFYWKIDWGFLQCRLHWHKKTGFCYLPWVKVSLSRSFSPSSTCKMFPAISHFTLTLLSLVQGGRRGGSTAEKAQSSYKQPFNSPPPYAKKLLRLLWKGC